MKNDISQPWLLTSSPVPPEEGNAGPHVAQSGSGLLLASTEHIANSSQPLVVDACWPSVWLSTSVCVCVNVWLKCLLTRLWHPPSANSLFDSLQTTRWCSERETERKKKSNRVKNFHKWTSYSKAYHASWHNDCSYTSSSSTLELIPSFSLLCSQMSSCRQCCR